MGWTFRNSRFEPGRVHADGNNVAWCCPECCHPIILVYQKNRVGSSRDNPSVCNGCGEGYYLDPPYGSRPEPPAGQHESPAALMRIRKVSS